MGGISLPEILSGEGGGGGGGAGETPLVPSLDETPDILDEYVIATLFQEVECGSWPNGRTRG